MEPRTSHPLGKFPELHPQRCISPRPRPRWLWSCTSVTPTLKRINQEDGEFEDSLGYTPSQTPMSTQTLKSWPCPHQGREGQRVLTLNTFAAGKPRALSSPLCRIRILTCGSVYEGMMKPQAQASIGTGSGRHWRRHRQAQPGTGRHRQAPEDTTRDR